MIKSQLVQNIHAQNRHLFRQDVERIVDALFDHITKSLAESGRVELRGFGIFGVKERPARTGRNPRTGQHISVPGKNIPYFKTSKEMRHRLNTSAPTEAPSAEDMQNKV